MIKKSIKESDIEATKKTLETDKEEEIKAVLKLFKEIKDYLIADVSGGIMIYLRKFFPVNGIHQLNSANP